MTQTHKRQVEAIKCGTVIDHIPAHIGFKILTLFHLTKTEQRVTVGLNLPSDRQGHKDLIKIENTFLTAEQIDQLAIYAPDATVNHIEDYTVVRKHTPALPACVTGVLRCPNSKCISRSEPVASRFKVLSNGQTVHLQCHYCEKIFERQALL